MALNLSSGPYFDDFDSTKNYNRILFKPGVAVQARELTQLQTMLSDQMTKLSDFTLKEGAIISGCEERITYVKYVKITDSFLGGDSLNNADLSKYIGATITGGTTGLKARILDVRTGTAGDNPDAKTLYIGYTDRAGTSTKVFSMNETLTVASVDTTVDGDSLVTLDTGAALAGSKERYEGSAPKIELSPGIMYARGTFIRTESLAAYISPNATDVDKIIGLYVTEKIVTASDDVTLKDNATGSYNINAPGADRLQFKASLRVYDYPVLTNNVYNVTLPENFYQFADWRNGEISRSKIKSKQLSNLGDILAQRSFEANGSYNIRGLQVVVHEHLNNGYNAGWFGASAGGDTNKLIFGITAGTANVAGYPVENRQTELPLIVNKPTDTKTETSVAQTTAYGNYTLITDVAGVWDVDGGGAIDLYDAPMNAVSGGNFSATTITTQNKIGTAKARFFKLESGTAGTSAAQYRLYLYDIRMSSGTFKEVEGIHFANEVSDGFADTVLSAAGDAVMQEGNYNRLVWELPYANLKTLQANNSAYKFDFKYIDEFDTQVASGTGSISLSPSAANRTFFFGNGTVSGTILTDNIQLVAVAGFTAGGVTYSAGQYIDLTHASITVSQSSESALNITFSSAPVSAAAVRVYVNMQCSQGVAPITKTMQSGKVIKIDTGLSSNTSTASGWYSLGVSDLIRIKSIHASDTGFTGAKINITNEFIIDNGQRDNYYGLARIKQKAASTVDLAVYRYIIVKMDYLNSQENGPTFACIDSYTGTGLGLQEIPLYTPSAGKTLDLRNCIDFRPYVNNTATVANSDSFDDLNALTAVNPSIQEVIDRPDAGLTNPVPTATFNTDLEYYLAQAYKVIVTQDNEFKVLKSQSANFPKIPQAPLNSLTLAEGILPAFPCLSPKAASYYKRGDLKVLVEQVRVKRYTMKDISGLEKRISNLEYYTALSLLEKESKSVQILDTDGVDRFKNGLMIDAFNTYGVMAVGHDDNKCSLDLKRQQLRAGFDSSIVGFKPLASSTTVKQTGDMFHIGYVEAVYTKQLQASKARNVVSELLYADPAPTNPVTPDEPAAPIIPAPPAVPVIPPKPPKPELQETSYTLTRGGAQIREGQTIAFGLEVRNLGAGDPLFTGCLSKEVPYTVSGVSSADIGGASLTGTFILDSSGDAFVVFNIASNDVSNDNKTLTLTIANGQSISVSIVDDTVVIPPPPPVLGPFAGSMNLIPSEDSWFDDSYAEPAYKNKEGSWDNLEITGAWKETWGAWELVSEDIVNATITLTEGEIGIPPKGYGGNSQPTSIDFETKAEGSGYWEQEVYTWTGQYQKYDVTTTIAGKNTQTWERTGSRIFYGNIPDEITENLGDSVINTEVSAFVRPISISGTVDGLLPSAVHTVTMGGINKGTLTTNANGRGTFSISVNKGEFRCGNITVEVADANTTDNIESYASSIFSSNGSKRTLQTTYVTTKWPAPPVGAVATVDKKIEIIPIGEDGRTMTKKGDVVITTHSENVGAPTWVPVEDVLVSSSRSDVITTGFRMDDYRRYDGTTYTRHVRDTQYDDVADTVLTLTVEASSSVDTKLDTTTNTIVKNDTTVTTVTLVDTAANTSANGSASNILTVTNSNGAIIVADGLDDFDHVAGVTTTEGRYALADEIAGVVITDSYSTVVNDVASDVALVTKTTEAANFDKLKHWKMPRLGELPGICLFDDPLAQTFMVEGMVGGMFVPSVDIFFRTISAEENNNGITLEIREVVNGYPGTTVVPNGQVFLRRSDIYASGEEDDGSVKLNSTKFRFKNLVHLQNNTEYCIVLRPEANDPGYEVWVGELGEIQKNTQTRITKQAHSGVLFTSANNRAWTAKQSEDLMFIVNRCKFDVDTDKVLKVSNKNTDWIVFDDNEWKTDTTPKFDLQDIVHGMTFTIVDAGAGYNGAAPTISISGGGGTGATATCTIAGGIATITLTNPGSGYTSAPTVSIIPSAGNVPTRGAIITARVDRARVKYFDSAFRTYELEVAEGSFTTGTLIGNGTTHCKIGTIANRNVDAYVLKASTLNSGEYGTIKQEIALTKTGESSANTTYSLVDTNSTVELDDRHVIYSYSNEAASFGGSKTALLQFTLNTPLNNLSPMIDVASLDMGVYANNINAGPVSEEVRFGGDANAKYISRQVVLADKQDAEDMRVFLDNKIPSGASVEVYGKFRNAEDDAEFSNDLYWKKLEVETSPKIATENFSQYVYKIPAKGSTNAGVNVDGVFEYTVHRIDSVAVDAGGSGYTPETAPLVVFEHSGSGYGATAEAIVVGGAVTGIRITNPGRDYEGGTLTASFEPNGGAGTGAVAGTVTPGTVTFTSFKDFAIKIVHLKSSNSTDARIPKSSALRAYALQV